MRGGGAHSAAGVAVVRTRRATHSEDEERRGRMCLARGACKGLRGVRRRGVLDHGSVPGAVSLRPARTMARTRYRCAARDDGSVVGSCWACVLTKMCVVRAGVSVSHREERVSAFASCWVWTGCRQKRNYSKKNMEVAMSVRIRSVYAIPHPLHAESKLERLRTAVKNK